MIPKATIYVYEVDGVIQSFVGVADGYIAGIFVSSEVQSQGIGRKLLNYCKERYSNLSLSVYKKNEGAVRFYKREGFLVTSEKIDENTNEIEFEMEWKK